MLPAMELLPKPNSPNRQDVTSKPTWLLGLLVTSCLAGMLGFGASVLLLLLLQQQQQQQLLRDGAQGVC